MDALAQIVLQLGLPSALVIFFVWRADRRETRMAARLDSQQQDLKEEQDKKLSLHEAFSKDLHNVIEKDHESRERNTKVLEELREETRAQTKVLENLECLRPWDGKTERRIGFHPSAGE